MDDGSTDDSVSVVSEYAIRDERFKIFERHREPKGAPTCRNIGLEKAQGEFVIFLDSDDLLQEFCISNRIDTALQEPQFDLWVFQTETSFEGKLSSDYFTKCMNDYLIAFLSHEIPWHTTAPLWSTEFILKLKGFNEKFSRLQDVELHTRALLSPTIRFKVFYNNQPDAVYRRKGSGQNFMAGISGFYSFLRIIYPQASTQVESQKLISALRNHIFHFYSFLVQYFERRKTIRSFWIFAKVQFYAYKNGIIKRNGIAVTSILILQFYFSSMIHLKNSQKKYLSKIKGKRLANLNGWY